jgi:hypothetical protein
MLRHAHRVLGHKDALTFRALHLQESGKSVWPPLDDTTPGVDNLMEDGTLLTSGQAFALSRSALLNAQ